MKDLQIERAQNLWSSFERKFEALAHGADLRAEPDFDFERIGGLAGPKEEILTYACAATDPGLYARWGTFPPSAMLLIGQLGSGKSLLARALAHRTETSFLRLDVPRIVLDVMHGAGKVGELIGAWSQILEEMPPLTVFFDELEFSQTEQLGEPRADLPIGPIMDFLLELVDRSIGSDRHLVVGSTSHPDTLRHAFVTPGRFERVVDVTPLFPGDFIEALHIHAGDAEKRAGRPLFDDIDWRVVVGQIRDASPGEWVRILHAVLRRKARCEASGEATSPVTTAELATEAERFKHARDRIYVAGSGNYL